MTGGDPFGKVEPLRPKAQGGPLSGIISAADLQDLQFPPIRWIVPEIMPEGLTLLAGPPKVGKSWLAMETALAVGSGGSVLGRPCEAGPVLYLALEDNARRAQRRLRKLAGDRDWPSNLDLAFEWPRLDGGLGPLRQWLAAHPKARMLIVDTLAPVRPFERANDGAHSKDYAALRGLHHIAREFNIAVLVIHHTRKAHADDPFDTVSGSTGLTGAADATLVLQRREGDGGLVLYGRGRDLEELELAIEFDTATCHWRDLGNPVEAFASDTRQAILAAIRAGKKTPGGIAEAAGITDDNARQTLRRMVRAGDLQKDGHGLYSIPSDPLSQPSQCHKDGGQSDNVTGVTGGIGAAGGDPEASNPENWK